MKGLKRTGIAAAIALLLTSLLVGGAGFYLARRGLPHLDGVERVAGLRARVEVIRDAAGVPHIYAASAEDLFFAQGYVTAQDRLWQMEGNRRAAWGRLSEVFGEFTLEADLLLRGMGLGRAAAAEEALLDPEMRRLLQAYSDGVNAYVAGRAGALPWEFAVLGLGFADWRPVDSLAWGKMMAWELSTNWSSEVLRAALVAKVGPERAAELMPSIPPGVVPHVAPGVDYEGLGISLLRRLERVTQLIRPQTDEQGSNNWVIAGARTESGRPLLANDPHLGLQLPSIWYEVHLVGGGLDVVGFSLPGTPGVVIGHNRHIAWGMTNAGADVQDLYVERRNPENPRQFLYQGNWEEATVVHEEIRVRGRAEPLQLEVPYTRHGPVINADAPEEAPLALRWTALEPSRVSQSILGLNGATNWSEFRAALADFAVPSQNFVYADVVGNIGYQLPGRIPVRTRGDGLLPVPGWTGEYEWEGYVPFEDLPSHFNPPQGVIVTANDRVVADGYAHLITHEWAPQFRADRIGQLLAAKERLSRDDVRAVQLDVYSPLAEAVVPRILVAGRQARSGAWGPPEAVALKALAELEGWDYLVAADRAAPTVFHVFYGRFVRNTFADELGPELFRFYLPAARSHVLALLAVLEDEENEWFDDVSTPVRETRDEIIWRSLQEAAALLARSLGDDPGSWHWGRLHTVTFAHHFGRVPLLDRILNRGPFPRAGDAATVNVSGYSFLAPYREAHQVSCRFIADLADWDESLAVIPTGQSGQVLSPHYDDQMKLWLAGDYHRLPYTRHAVEQTGVARLELMPGN